MLFPSPSKQNLAHTATIFGVFAEEDYLGYTINVLGSVSFKVCLFPREVIGEHFWEQFEVIGAKIDSYIKTPPHIVVLKHEIAPNIEPGNF